MSLKFAPSVFLRSPPQPPYEYKEAGDWGMWVRYLEIGTDGYATRQVDEYANGHLCRYDREHWDDQFGTLADAHFSTTWTAHWGKAVEISKQEFERKWVDAEDSLANTNKRPQPRRPPPWLPKA